MKTKNTISGKIELEIAGVRYCGTVELSEAPRATKSPAYKAWGVRIDRKNNDPYAAVEYIGAAAGYNPAIGASPGSWADNPIFAKIKPCLFKDGAVAAYLDPNDYNKTTDGRAVDVLRNYFDTMVEFGRMYYRICKDERYTYVEVTDDEKAIADGFTDGAFRYKGKPRKFFYIGAYKGYIEKGKLRSINGKMPSANETIGAFRKAAQANGEGYEIMPFNKLTLLQALYIIRYKSLNSRAALGKGVTESRDFAQTGGTDEGGLYIGSPYGTAQVKCHGIEDLWGNIFEWVDGFITTDNAIKISDGNFNDTAEGYETAAELPENVYGLITDIYGDNKLGFIPKAADDDADMGKTYYCNYGATWRDDIACLPFFGGYRSSGAGAGAFYFRCSYSASAALAIFGARLCFCGRDE